MGVRVLDLPAGQRPRERLLHVGAAALTDAELLAILLGSGRRGVSAIDLAHELLRDYGGVCALAVARPEELARNAGVGPAKAARIVAACALALRAADSRDPGQLICDSASLAELVVPLLARERVERLVVVVLDARHAVLRTEVVAQGAVDRTPMPVREVLATVLRHDGRALAIAHNHPSGTAEPSAADVAATHRLREAAGQVGLRLIDHVVVAGTTWTSATCSG